MQLLKMRVRLWLICFGLSTVWAQKTNTKVSQDESDFSWGWELTPLGDAAGTVGRYYVKLPESEQDVRYSADNSGYHGALSITTSGDHHSHSQNFALGQRAIQLTQQKSNLQQSGQIPNATSPTSTSANPVDIYVLRQQYTAYLPESNQPVSTSKEKTHHKGLTQLYNIQAGRNEEDNNNAATKLDSNPLWTKEVNTERYKPILQVFKNCSDDNKMSVELRKDLNKSKELFSQIPYELHDLDELDLDNLPNRPLTYRGEVKFRVEPPNASARNERFYYTTIETPVAIDNEPNITQEGIERLVASTQDLISNEDLLSINHAVEKHVNEPSDDIIKPRSRWALRNPDTDAQDSRNHLTVKAKIENIVQSHIEHTENNEAKEQVLHTTSNNYNFALPIYVPDPSYSNVKEQIVNNLVSTMVPYMATGYEIIGVKDSSQDNTTEWSDQELINVTPRPISVNYLTPITVALRLLNNDTYSNSNSLDDHEGSDSELISETVRGPNRDRTIVQIQESIPVDITHINDVEVHEYIDEGRSNNKSPLDVAKSLYHKYIDALKSSKKIQDNMNKILYQYGTMSTGNTEKEQAYETKDNLEPSENIQTLVEVDPNQNNGNHARSESASYYNSYNDNQKIIQPIIIEKEVPVTKFVDRFIEKQVPYPQPFEVKVPVDRPVPVAVPYEKIVEKPVEVTRYVDKPYPVEVARPYPVEVKVPYPVHQNVFVDRPIHIPFPVERVIERPIIHPIPVPTPIAIPYEVQIPVEHKVLYPVPVEKPIPVPVEVEKPVERIVNKEVPVPYPVEKKVPYPVHYETRVPVPYPVEKRIPVPVEKIVEKPVTVTKFVEKPVRVEVPVPQPVAVPVHVPQPYPVDRIVEKKIPYPVPVDRIVEKKVHVKVPYPVEKIVEKIVEKPVVVTKFVDKPYPVEKKVPYPVEKIIEKKIPYAVRIAVPYPVEKIVEKQVHTPFHFNRYNTQEQALESQNNPQFLKNEGRIKNIQELTKLAQYYQLLKERQQKIASHKNSNNHASSYQYVNNITGRSQEIKKLVSPQANNTYQYNGPPPNTNEDNWREINKNYVLEFKLRRNDREPRVTNLRIEYGGFRPPMIPSTEVDLDGIPVNKES